MIKKCSIFLFAVLWLLLGLPVNASGSTAVVSEEALCDQAKGAYLMEASSGREIYAKNAEEKLYPASMTKMMGLLLIYEQLNAGSLQLSDMVTTSETAAGMGGSQVYLEVGETMSVEDLLKSICIASANDAMVAMAEKIGGTHAGFVEMMNAKAKELGLVNTHFTNASGLHDPDHYSCPRDMAIIGAALLAEGGEDLLAITSTYDAYIREGQRPAVLARQHQQAHQTAGGSRWPQDRIYLTGRQLHHAERQTKRASPDRRRHGRAGWQDPQPGSQRTDGIRLCPL